MHTGSLLVKMKNKLCCYILIRAKNLHLIIKFKIRFAKQIEKLISDQ